MADVDTLYREVKGDLEILISPLFECAQGHVRKLGAFLPFGAALDRSGEVMFHHASVDEEPTTSDVVLPLLHNRLRKVATDAKVSAVGVCEWVKITPEGGKRTDAIKVLVEHERGLAVAFYMPCRRRALFRWRFDDTFAQSAPAEVSPAWGKSKNYK